MFAASLSLNFAGASILHPSLYFQLSTIDCRLLTNCPILRTYEKRVRNMCKMNRCKMIRVELTQNEHLQKKGEGERMRSSSLFCSSKNLNLAVFMLCRTLSQKTPGVGVPAANVSRQGQLRGAMKAGAFAVRKSRCSQLGTRPTLLESHPCATPCAKSHGITSLQKTQGVGSERLPARGAFAVRNLSESPRQVELSR
jgi:hypothetical protein